MISTRTTLAVAATLFAAAACTTPDLTPPPGGTGSAAGTSRPGAAQTGVPVADQAFVAQAAYGGLSEVALGELANKQAGSPQVQQFGQRMFTEHRRANEELVAIAKRKGITPPTAPDAGRQAVAAALATLEGANFDRQYLQQQLAEHEMAVALYRAEATNGADPDIRAFATKWLPALEDHVATIRRMMPTAS